MRKGFSLVELSIVLVILGLLTGGILAGRALIRQSELRAVISEYNRYVTATNSFRDKYFGLPGDITNATQIWGAAASGTNCVTTASSDTSTCDGNGDGLIYPSTNSNESFRYWQQLANAGLIEGHYNGVTDGSTGYSASTANSPSSKLSGAGWFVWYWGNISGDPTAVDGNDDRMYIYGLWASNQAPGNSVFTGEELWNIDTKIDDGKAMTGKLVPRAWNNAHCTNATSGSQTSANYVLGDSTKGCVALFRDMF